MSSSSRRYEILLPLRFNDGQPVPDELLADTLLELRQRFGAVSSETQIIRGYWQHEGQLYRDELIRVFVDAPDVPDSRPFFREFKERVKTRFRQLDIWMTTYPVEVLEVSGPCLDGAPARLPERTFLPHADVLIGAIVLEDLDLLVDCRTQALQPRDPRGIIVEIE